MKRNKIIKHYKSFFGLEDMGLAENDHLMIDWAESLVKDCNLHFVSGSLPAADTDWVIQVLGYKINDIDRINTGNVAHTASFVKHGINHVIQEIKKRRQ